MVFVASRLPSVLVIAGLLVFSILGYVAMQQYIERSDILKATDDVTAGSTDFHRLKDLPQVRANQMDAFIKAHSDGIPIDYLAPVSYWPSLRPGFKAYLYKEGCVVNNRPQETCSSQAYVAVNAVQKKAIFIYSVEDLPQIIVPLETEASALALASFITSKRMGKYFGSNFATLVKVSDADADDAAAQREDYTLSDMAWRRLQLPETTVRREGKQFVLERVGFVPFGEKQIILVKETLSTDGHYAYDIDSILHKGRLVPVDVKND